MILNIAHNVVNWSNHAFFLFYFYFRVVSPHLTYGKIKRPHFKTRFNLTHVWPLKKAKIWPNLWLFASVAAATNLVRIYVIQTRFSCFQKENATLRGHITWFWFILFCWRASRATLGLVRSNSSQSSVAANPVVGRESGPCRTGLCPVWA